MVHPCCGFRLIICTRVIGGIDIALAVVGIIRFSVQLSIDDCHAQDSIHWAYLFCGITKILQCIILIGLAILLFIGVNQLDRTKIHVFMLARLLVAIIPLVIFCLCDFAIEVDETCHLNFKLEVILLLCIFLPYTFYILWVVHVFSSLLGKDKNILKSKLTLMKQDANSVDYLSPEEVEYFLTGNPNSFNFFERFPFNKEFQVSEKRLHTDPKQLIGVGSYGSVYKGCLQTPGCKKHAVAIKILKPDVELNYFKAALSQLKTITSIGCNLHVVNCIGAVIDNISKGRLQVVFEYCDGGNMEAFLSRNRGGFVNQVRGDVIDRRIKGNTYINSPFSIWAIKFDTVDLIKWAFQISRGMRFLASKQVIHGSLNTRNILFTGNKTVKISDFGLSCKFYEYTQCVKNNQVPPKWRTMAIESLRNGEFTIQSDVWSFGVTLWEMFSIGEVSCPELTWSLDFALQVCEKLRLSKPAFATEALYSIMLDCWKSTPTERPTFEELHAIFSKTLSQLNS